MSKSLHERLTTLDNQGKSYQLDYLTLHSGFVFRNADVLHHDEASIVITQDTQKEGRTETFINTSEIATSRIKTL